MPTKKTILPTALRQALLSGLFIITANVQAQTTSPGAPVQAANSSDTAVDKEEVVRLSPFEVRSGTNQGYIASDTMSGSRVASKIFDVPASVSVITRDLLDDMGAVDPWGALSRSAPGVTTYGSPGVFSGASIRQNGFAKVRCKGGSSFI